MKNYKVIVVADELNNVIRQSTNPEYGYIRVEQKVAAIKGRFMNIQTKSALIAGKMKDLQEMNLTAGLELDGKIVTQETFEPTNPMNHQQDIKYAGDTGVPCTKEGQAIYRQTYFTTDMKVEDRLIQHDNTDQIKYALSSKKLDAIAA